MKQLWFGKKLPKDPDVEALRIFMLGDILHEFMQKQVMKYGLHEERITVMDDGIMVRGRYDYLDDRTLIDFKTCRRLPPGTEAKRDHQLQMMIYMKALGRDKGRVVYIQKDNFQISDREVTFNEELYNSAMQSFKDATKYLDEGTVPPKLEDYPKNWRCRYCNWRKECDAS